MLHKRILPYLQFCDEPTANLVNVMARGGVDRFQMQKLAAAEYVFHVDIKPRKGYSYIHLISCGAGETYGANSNTDYYNKYAHEVIIPEPRRPEDKVIMLGGGLDVHHDSFLKYGAVYNEHKNALKKGPKRGDVYAATVNQVMNRGELIICVPDDSWGSELQKLATGQPLYFSIGVGVPYDICSICANQAAKKEQYCNHMLLNRGGLTKTGHQVFTYNDCPLCHDISKVETPAEKIAFALSKVASAVGTTYVPDDDSPLYVPLSVVSALGTQQEKRQADMLAKLSAMEKKILCEGAPVESGTQALTEDLSPAAIKMLKKYSPDDLLAALHQHNCMLSPRDFVRVILVRNQDDKDIPGLSDLPDALRGMFGRLEALHAPEATSDAAYSGHKAQSRQSLDELIGSLVEQIGLGEGPLQKRVTILVLRGGHKNQKEATATHTPSAAAQLLAKEYGKYQLAFLADSRHASLAELAVHHNHAIR